MSDASSQSSKPVLCPSCGLVQTGSGLACGRCGHPLNTPGLIYRREANGTWTIIRDIDLSSLVPKPPPLRKKLISKRGATFILVVAATGATLDMWCWKTFRDRTQQESEAITQYLDQPVGRIVPSLELAYQTGEGGHLIIMGETNLPEGTVLELQVYSGQVLVAVDFPVTVTNGKFGTRPLLERGKPFLPTSYHLQIRARFEKSWQPPPVLRVVGGLGERLGGEDIQRNDATVGARLAFEEDFVLNL